MLLICNKKTKRKNGKDQLILGQTMYCITIIADKNKEVTSFPYHSKEAWIHSVLCEPAICQNLDKMDSWHSLQKFTFLRNYWIESNGVFCKMQVMSYICITENHTLIHLSLLKLLMRKVWLYFFFGHTVCIHLQLTNKIIMIFSYYNYQTLCLTSIQVRKKNELKFW